MRFLIIFVLLMRFCMASRIDYSMFSSPEEMISYEELQVQEVGMERFALADAYMDLGESYLLSGDYGKALQTLAAGIELAKDCKSTEERRLSRALLGLSIAYANMDLLEEFYCAIEVLRAELVTSCCQSCQEIKESEYQIELISSPKIAGPDKIAVGECIERVYGTARMANDLISFVKRPEVQFLLRTTIDGLADSAARCCREGGLWKGCIGPLLDKWYLWNQKWKVFGIPPDPAWD